MFYWTGVGSRDTTEDEYEMMISLGYHIASLMGILRSGNAPGSDLAFETGYWEAYEDRLTDQIPHIYVPWPSFRHGDFPNQTRYVSERNLGIEWANAARLISKVHPAWERLSRGARALHTRNAFQPLGARLSRPSRFLLACSDTDKHGVPKGGTRTAWVLAEQYGIPCFNIRDKTLFQVESFINSIIG